MQAGCKVRAGKGWNAQTSVNFAQTWCRLPVQFFGGDVGVIALPAFFALTRVQRETAIGFDEPIPRGFPAREVLAIEERDETSRVCRRVEVFRVD